MIQEKGPTWGALIKAALIANKYDAHKALQLTGLKVKEQLQESIRTGPWEPLKDATADRKGHDVPLIDSHNMINAVDYVVS
jgi:hypothetical protein